MSKKDISKILTSGSAKQRLLMIAEDIARGKFKKEQILTEHEFNALSDSFRKPEEIKLYNKWLKVDRRITNALQNIQGLKYEVLVHNSNLRGYILVWDTIQSAELLGNLILHEIKDPKERARVSYQAGKMSDFLFTKINTDKEGYLDINVDFEKEELFDENGKVIKDKTARKKTKEYSLWYVMSRVREEAINATVRFISWRDAILDYMKDEGFNIKTYKEALLDMNDDVNKPVIHWNKYLSDFDNFIPDIPKTRADKLKSKYAITPKVSELKADPEIYNQFKKDHLSDE